MAQTTNNNINKDELLQVRLNAVLAILGILTFIFGMIVFNLNRDIHAIKDEIADKQKQLNIVQVHNKKVDEKTALDNRKLNVRDVTNASIKFNNGFYTWSTWEQFISNMEYLQKEFPNVRYEGIVSIETTNIGNTKDSPESSYNTTRFITTKDGEIAELIEQRKKYQGSESKTLWYKFSEYKNNKYSVKYLKTASKF